MKRVLIVCTMFLGFGTQALATDCRCQPIDGSIQTVLSGVSKAGKQLTLRFEANPVTTATNLGFLCVDPSTTVSTVRLWMPDMNHGSSPTRLITSNNCSRVERVNFIMPGLWDLQIALPGADTGTLSLFIVRAQ